MSVYKLKPAFQRLLRPMVRTLFRAGVNANMVTVTTCFASLSLGLWLFFTSASAHAMLAIPVWMLLRMALNAIDGMLAREHGQMSVLGAFLNELTDIASDAALFLPFALWLPAGGFWIGCIAVLAALSECAGAIAPALGASRRYDGPLGKSDRAVVFGALALWIGLAGSLPAGIAPWIGPLIALAIAVTVYRRVDQALGEIRTRETQP